MEAGICADQGRYHGEVYVYKRQWVFLTGSFEGGGRGVYTAWCSRIRMLGKVESLADEGLGQNKETYAHLDDR